MLNAPVRKNARELLHHFNQAISVCTPRSRFWFPFILNRINHIYNFHLIMNQTKFRLIYNQIKITIEIVSTITFR